MSALADLYSWRFAPSGLDSIIGVILRSSDIQMVGVHTRTHIALVQHQHSLWNRPMKFFKSNSVRSLIPAKYPQNPIARRTNAVVP